jgi:hypothetical protein
MGNMAFPSQDLMFTPEIAAATLREEPYTHEGIFSLPHIATYLQDLPPVSAMVSPSISHSYSCPSSATRFSAQSVFRHWFATNGRSFFLLRCTRELFVFPITGQTQ